MFYISIWIWFSCVFKLYLFKFPSFCICICIRVCRCICINVYLCIAERHVWHQGETNRAHGWRILPLLPYLPYFYVATFNYIFINLHYNSCQLLKGTIFYTSLTWKGFAAALGKGYPTKSAIKRKAHEKKNCEKHHQKCFYYGSFGKSLATFYTAGEHNRCPPICHIIPMLIMFYKHLKGRKWLTIGQQTRSLF